MHSFTRVDVNEPIHLIFVHPQCLSVHNEYMRSQESVDEKERLRDYLFHAVRLGLAGRRSDVFTLVTRIAKSMGDTDPQFTRQLAELAKASGGRSALRAVAPPSPVDQDSRSSLLTVLEPERPDVELVLATSSSSGINRVLRERRAFEELIAVGLAPASTVLLTGPPGVGKSLAARWLSFELGLPLAVLDLGSVMSSYLGKTGQNIKHAFDFAKEHSCILFVDEMDAVGKRRDDDSDIGELKRLVTVLLQEMDQWPSHSLLLAATNHHHLLDAAIWRRFDEVIHFDLPDRQLVLEAITKVFYTELPNDLVLVLSMTLEGRSLGECEKVCNRLRREVLLSGQGVSDIVASYCQQENKHLSAKQRQELGALLIASGLSQRKASEVSGVARDTLRTRNRKVEK